MDVTWLLTRLRWSGIRVDFMVSMDLSGLLQAFDMAFEVLSSWLSLFMFNDFFWPNQSLGGKAVTTI